MIKAMIARGKSIARQQIGPRIAARRPRRVDLPLKHWGLSVGPNGHLHSGAVDLVELAQREGTPLHVASAVRLDANATAALGPLRAGRGADIFYSYKTNPVPTSLERLHRNGIGAEVISPYELWLAFALGVPPDRIIYNGPAKSKASLREAIERRILLINANSVRDAQSIAAVAAEVGTVANLGLRVSLRQTWGGQFGITSSSPVLIDTIRAALEDPHVELRGLHVHRGSTVRTMRTWDGYIDEILECCDTIRAATGWSPSILDVGGSLACPTVDKFDTVAFRLNRAYGSDLLPPDPAACLTIAEASARVAERVHDHFTAAHVPVPTVVQEPGRSLTGDTQLLLTTVLDVKLDGRLPHAVLDAGINVAEAARNEYHQLFSASAPTSPPVRSYRLAGPICTPADVLYNNWRLPELEPGHVLAIMDSGAYFVPFSTTFSFPPAPVVLQDGDEIHRARDRLRFEDLVAADHFTGHTPGA